MPQKAGLIFMIGLVAGGVLAIFRPNTIVGWVRQAHPNLSEDAGQFLWIVRLIGVGLVVIGGLIVMGILGLFSR